MSLKGMENQDSRISAKVNRSQKLHVSEVSPKYCCFFQKSFYVWQLINRVLKYASADRGQINDCLL